MDRSVPLDDGSPQSRPSMARNIALASVLLMGRAFLTFGIASIVARTLGADGRGRVVYVTNLASLLGLAAGSAAYVGINILRTSERTPFAVLYTAATTVGLAAGTFFGAAYVVAAAVTGGFAGVNVGLLVVVAATIVSLAVLNNVSAVASLEDKIASVTWTQLTGVALYLIVTAATAATGTITVSNNIAAWAITSIVPLCLLIWPARVIVFSNQDVAKHSRRLGSLALRANVAAITMLAVWRIDVTIVAARRGYRELGIYSVAVALAEVILVGGGALRAALLPHYSLGREEVREAVSRATRVGLAGAAVLAVALSITGRPLLRILFGEQYVSAYAALLLLLPGVVFFVLQAGLFDYIAAHRGLRALTIMSICALVVNVGADYVLLGTYSYTAAAAVSTMTYAIVFVTCLVLFRRESGARLVDVLVLRREDVRAISDNVAGVFSRTR